MRIGLLVLGLLIAGPAAAERLVLEPYPGPPAWKQVTYKVSGLQFLRELIPEGQRIEAYRDILTAQSFPQQRGASPSDYLRNVFAGAARACENVRVNGPTERREGGYAVAYAQVYCSRQTGTAFGVNMLFKAIAGSDALYVVQREFRVPPSAVAGVQSADKAHAAALIAQMRAQSAADAYLVKSVYLCGAASTEARCRSR